MRLPNIARGQAASSAGPPADTSGAPWNLWPIALLLVLFAGAMVLYTYSLGHIAIAPWDEAVHAVVAEHIAVHPLQPTLYEVAALTPPGTTDWTIYHIWLHIPPLGLWASALSMRLLGDTPFAFRLPGVIFVGLGMLVTYLLGHRLYGPLAGILGAAFVGYAPYPLLVGQGYVFGDMTDVPLMLFTPLAVLALVQAFRTGRYRWLVFAGVCQGLCYLAKGGFGLAPTAVMLALYISERLFPREEGWLRVGLWGTALYAGVALMVAAPFTLYTQRVFPAAANIDAADWKKALFFDYEGWGRPLDYHVTAYLYAMYGPALALLLVSAALMVAARALGRRSRADLVTVVWIAALYIPLSLAVTKAVPFTYPAVAAVGLVFGRFLALGLSSRSLLSRAGALGLLLGAVGTTGLLLTGHLSRFETSYHVILPVQFYVALSGGRALLYVYEAGLSAVAGLLCALVIWAVRSRSPAQSTIAAPSLWHELRANARDLLTPTRGVLAAAKPALLAERLFIGGIVLVAALVLGGTWLRYDLQDVASPAFDPGPAPVLGPFLTNHTPANATIFMVSRQPLIANTRLMVMFWAHRDVYDPGSLGFGKLDPQLQLATSVVCPLASEATRSASPMFILTDEPYIGTPAGSAHGWSLYTPACP